MLQSSGPPRHATSQRNCCVKIKWNHQGSLERESILVLNWYRVGPSGTQLTETVLQIQELIPALTCPLKHRHNDNSDPILEHRFNTAFSPSFSQAPIPKIVISEDQDLPTPGTSLPSPSHVCGNPTPTPTAEFCKLSSKAKVDAKFALITNFSLI